jgi:hypothetical protein
MSDDSPRAPKAPPNLRLGLRDKPEVKALLEELGRDLKTGEDPLFYELPEEPPDDPSACAPNEARVYVGPTALPMARHKTLEMDSVKVKPEVDPRRAVTQRVQVRRPAATGPDTGREDAPPMSGPASTEPKSVAGRKRTAVAGALVVAAVVAAFWLLKAMGGPKGKEDEKGAASATAPSAAVPSTGAIPSGLPSPSGATSVTPKPSVTATSSATSSRPVKPLPGRPKGPLEDPYEDASTPLVPLPAVTVTAAPSAAPPATAVPVTPPLAPPKSASPPPGPVPMFEREP